MCDCTQVVTVPSKAKPLLQDTKDNRKGFYKYVAHKRKTKDNVE